MKTPAVLVRSGGKLSNCFKSKSGIRHTNYLNAHPWVDGVPEQRATLSTGKRLAGTEAQILKGI